MILRLFRKNSATEPVYAVYNAIVAQSRRPLFYAEWGIPDTVTGRFDMICLHTVLVFRRLRGEGRAARDFSQAVFDLFFKDMDRSLRELGVSDVAVPKRIQKMGNLFYGLLASLGAALDSGETAEVEAVLGRNFFAGEAAARPDLLAAYALEGERALAAVPAAGIVAGRLDFGPFPGEDGAGTPSAAATGKTAGETR